MALIQLELKKDNRLELPADEVIKLYQEKILDAKNLMMAKNHDYGEAWRDMRVSSLTDLILMKILRVKQIEDNKGKTITANANSATNVNNSPMLISLPPQTQRCILQSQSTQAAHL